MEHVDMFDATDKVFDSAYRVIGSYGKQDYIGYSRVMGNLIGHITYHISKLPKDEGDKMLTSLLDSLDNINK